MKDVSLNNIRPLSGGIEQNRPGSAQNKGDVGLFKEALNNAKKTIAGPVAETTQLKFSNHAIDRMQSRGIRFSPEEMTRIESAAAKASAKGAKECLLIGDQAALIVSLKDKTVVTVMDKANLKDNVFTNIDATVMI